MSAWRARSGSFAAILGLLGSKKWMTRDGAIGISRTGSGAPSARGLKKSRGLRIAASVHHSAGRREGRVVAAAGGRRGARGGDEARRLLRLWLRSGGALASARTPPPARWVVPLGAEQFAGRGVASRLTRDE